MDAFSLCRVDGFLVGHAEDCEAGTGCTAVLTPAGAAASVYTLGFAPGSRETDLLRPESSPKKIHELLLAGIARAVFPAHLLFDGDTVFTLASNTGPAVDQNVLGASAARVTARAVLNSAYSAGA
jgi:L-aminopeptidase/D-esterase-like protein